MHWHSSVPSCFNFFLNNTNICSFSKCELWLFYEGSNLLWYHNLCIKIVNSNIIKTTLGFFKFNFKLQLQTSTLNFNFKSQFHNAASTFEYKLHHKASNFNTDLKTKDQAPSANFYIKLTFQLLSLTHFYSGMFEYNIRVHELYVSHSLSLKGTYK